MLSSFNGSTDSTKFSALHLNSKRQFCRAYGVFEKLRYKIIVSLDDVDGDKYFHCEFYDRRDQLSREALLVKTLLSPYLIHVIEVAHTRMLESINKR